jgi:catalase
MIANRIVHGCAAALACLLASPAFAQDADPQAIVDGQFAVGGNHPKVRASGAKGICVTGTFTPTPEAASLSKAPLFAKAVPVTARFSMGGSNPNVSDKTKPVTRGFSLRFADPAGDLALLLVSAPMFGTRTPQQLLEFITVRLPGPDGKPDAEKIKAFTAANPETTRQAAFLNARPVPASFAGVDYWAVQPYTLTDSAGKATVAKLKAVAAAGPLGLTDDELKAKPDSFYADELKERLGKGPAAFDLVAILAEPGDPLDDATATWPEDKRRTAKLGSIAIAGIEPNATCDAKTFDPVVEAPDGIAGPVNDPMFAIRSPAYAISLTRRTP